MSIGAATVISIVSLAIALVSFTLKYSLARRAAVRARKPVLVFVDVPEQGTWMLQNVGNGPALNVLVAQREDGKWFNPVIVPPLSADSSYPLKWLGRVNSTGLGATYSDFEDTSYTSTTGGERSRTFEGNRLPNWSDREVRRHWEPELAGVQRSRIPWAARESAFSA